MRQSRSMLPPSGLHARILSIPLVLIASLGLIAPLRADIDATITQAIWKMKYQVQEADINNPAWLAADQDKDGIPNGVEIAAGTDPFNPTSTVKISAMNIVGNNVQVTFPTINRKQYFLQATATLGNPSSWQFIDASGQSATVQTGVKIVGDGNSLNLSATRAPDTFYRVLVQDMDTDGDGVSDWAEVVAGYDPNDANTSGVNGGDDHAAFLAGIATSNVVTITTTKTSATQPADALTPPVETGSITINRAGPMIFSTITVPLQKSGTAVEGTDYDALPASVTFDGTKHETAIVLAVNPKANAALRTNVTAIVKVLAGGGYTLGSRTSGSVVINPAGLASGTGLTGKYFNTSSSNYTTQSATFNGTPQMTRTDATIDFANRITSVAVGNPCTITTERPHQIATTASVTISGMSGGSPVISGTYTATQTGANTFTIPVNCTVAPTSVANSLLGGTNGWSVTGGPIGMSPQSANTAFSVRWVGQVLPQYSETYTFDFRSDDSAKLWVNGKLLIDRWATQGATEYVNTIDLKAGVPYDIQIDYWNSSGTAEARLYWWSPSQVKQIIPQGRLFPQPALASKLTNITSALAAVGYVSIPFRFDVTTPDISGTTTYAVAANSGPLPPGLSLNASTGAITGTPTADPPYNNGSKTYNVAINATNAAAGTVTGSSVVNITIFNTGSVTREILTASGSNVSDIVLPTGTPAHDTIPTIDDGTDYSNNTGERLRGYLVPPRTGNYYFWLAANNAAEFWLSNDAEQVNKVRRAVVTASSGDKTWNPPATGQQSQWLSLVAGQKYYFEVLHNTGGDADDYVTVGWCQDDIGTTPSVSGSPNPWASTPVIPNGGGSLQGYPLSGTVPSYIFQPFDYPLAATAGGTLYATNLGPQGASTTKASGAANLRVDAAGNSAILHFTYGGLTSPRTANHLHTDAFDNHSQGEIVFDIDDIDAFHPELKTPDGGYIWNFTPTGSFTSVAQLRGAIEQGRIYLNIHSVMYPAGEIRGNLTLVDGSQTPPDASLYAEPAATDSNSNDAHAARFLNQASFGASPTDVTYVKNNGFLAWINDQLTQTPTHSSDEVVANLSYDINNPYPSANFTNAWWKYSIIAPDQLRQRLAFALSEIMVVSYQSDVSGPLQRNGRALADFYDNLVDYCLPTSGLADSGNFRGILKAVTLTPAMGIYLDMRGNQKGDLALGRHPNENYAREIMQLFSVGLNRFWDDGKLALDSGGNLVPTYTQSTILGMAALLTGWNYAQANQGNGRAPTGFGPAADYLNPMTLVPTRHDLDAKLLLDNVVTPAATGRTPRVSISGIGSGLVETTITTGTQHGLRAGDTVTIAGITGGTFGAPINATHLVTAIVSPTQFKVGVGCSSAPAAAGTVTGSTILSATTGTSGISAVTGSQSDSSGTASPHPYDQYGLTELNIAMDNIVNNSNVPIFICRQLIQRLVTSDPDPGYLYRVVQKFKNNGSGVRGDLAAVVKQILLDGAARSSTAAQANPAFGKQREPVMRITAPARAFPSTGYTGTYTQLTGADSYKLRITTSGSNDFSAGFSISLDFHDQDGNPLTSDPYTNPTSTSYSVASTLGIASTYTEIASISVGASPITITTTQPHGLATGNTVTLSGVSGKFGSTINTTLTATVTGPNTFTVPVGCTRVMQIASVTPGNPCTVTTAQSHGMTTGDTVTINGVNGGTFSPSINNSGNNTHTVTVTGANTFTVPVNCTVAPTSYTPWRHVSNPCRITTVEPHGLSTGSTITISGVSGGSFNPSISNATFVVTVVDSTSFTIPVNCTSPSTNNTGSIVGGNTLDVSATGMVRVIYNQAAGSNAMTVSTAGPATDVAVPGAGGTIKSRVYLKFLTQTAAGGAIIPADAVYDVQTNGSNLFTVTTADTPATARSGYVLIPKISTSYTPESSNTVVKYNTYVNHNLQIGDHIWVDVPVVNTPVTDAEYAVSVVTDEDHFKTSYLPPDLNGGTYPKPSGSNNGITIWPLVAPPLGRSGNVKISQSTFNLGGTDATLSQSPMNSPTVFNFFLPDYRYPGTLANNNVDSPEFQLTTDTNVVNLTNSVTNMIIGTGGSNGNLNGLSSFYNGNGSIVLDVGTYMTTGWTNEAGIPNLVDAMASLLVGGPLSSNTRTEIINFVNHKNGASFDYLPYTTPTNQQMRDRVRAVIHLILTSAEYATQK